MKNLLEALARVDCPVRAWHELTLCAEKITKAQKELYHLHLHE